MKWIIATVFLTGALTAQAGEGPTPQPFHNGDLVGAWKYVEAYTELSDGTKIDQFGPNPQGVFIILANGVCSHIVMEPNLPAVKSGLLKHLTADEAMRLATGSLSWYGTCKMDGESGTFTATIEHSDFPNFDGVEQTRVVTTLTRETLQYVNPLTTSGHGAKVFAVLRRIW
jgi:hypothetical protein